MRDQIFSWLGSVPFFITMYFPTLSFVVLQEMWRRVSMMAICLRLYVDCNIVSNQFNIRITAMTRRLNGFTKESRQLVGKQRKSPMNTTELVKTAHSFHPTPTESLCLPNMVQMISVGFVLASNTTLEFRLLLSFCSQHRMENEVLLIFDSGGIPRLLDHILLASVGFPRLGT